MTLDPDALTGISDDLVRLYADAEAQLLAIIAAQAARHAEAPDWAERQLAEINRLQGLISAQVAVIASRGTDAAAVAVVAGWEMGEVHAAREIAEATGDSTPRRGAGPDAPAPTTPRPPTSPPPTPAPGRPGRSAARPSVRGAVSQHAIGAIITEATNTLAAAHTSVLRTIPDAYRQVVREVAAVQTTGAITAQQAQQTALNRWADRGISTFVDRGGRTWTLPAYSEMSVRTAVHRAYLEGHTNQMQGAGYDLIIVSSHPNPAPMCAPYENQVLSLSGAHTGSILIPSTKDGQPVPVHVAASLDEARSNGYMHVNCRHRHRLFIPGSTKQESAPLPDPQGYKDTQVQRGLERRIRKWKRREAVAMDDQERQYARAHLRKAQADIRAHVKRTGLDRRSYREQVRVGKPGATPSPAATPAAVAVDA